MVENTSLIGITPFGQTNPRLVSALSRANALGIVDVGEANPDIIQKTIAATARTAPQGFGVLLPDVGSPDLDALPSSVTAVVLPRPFAVKALAHQRVFVQVTSETEAAEAVKLGAFGLIAKGCESGGRIGDESSFVLLQRLVRKFSVPIWVQGGIGLHTAAAAVAGGAAGVVLDSQLALVRESELPENIKHAIASMDGSETVVQDGRRVFSRPGIPALAAGQDAAFARGFAERFKTAGGVVRAIRRAISEHIRDARAANPLAAGSPLAVAHGITYPIAQGPMTRVSDQPAFAEAVARSGGLPFLALALMRGDQVRTLLAETAKLLQGRPWGVGILGFVPAELREEQLKEILEARPPVALIAGGRPSQARSLEAAGIPAYLHVPSPGLLDLFLKDGSRRFVFEGSECGGHIGPRTSFALWEQQIDRLLAFDRPEELSVLFAGGIHDAVSAAMVSVMAAPLAARGAKVGVLMGTAYIFTKEAVATGAILPVFQDVAVACERTALLETAPGHTTRCVDTQFAEFFRKERARLEAEHLSPMEVWASLEQLNLGRLRIASKGLRRDGEALKSVTKKTAQRDGLFMIGQVATLREQVGSIAGLHQDVSDGSTAHLASIELQEAAAPASPWQDIAIVGMACVFPGAPDLDAYWSNVVNEVDSISEVPKERWNPEIYYDATGRPGEKTPSKWGGFLPEIPFDPLSFGIPPRSLAAIEPTQLLSLEVARRALADAGYADTEFDHKRTSVIFGAEAGTDLAGAYGFRALFPQYMGQLSAALDHALPSLTEDSFPGVLANVIAGRIANRLNLGGLNFTVDAACAASLAALDIACKELLMHSSDMVLCGGADLHNSIGDFLLFSSVHALSPQGRCRTFDAEADGIALGEGVAAVVLKRRQDAERDGDRIYAVIKGIGGSSDGRSLGLTAPRKEGQVLAIERAYQNARISPTEIGLVEAHGTGTVVGDATELATLNEAFSKAGAAPQSCRLGSVKSQIGHTKCAAGMAGLIKAALALHHSVLPPTLHLRRPNPAYRPEQSPFAFGTSAQPWLSENKKAGVSAFGFGGTNFHAVLAAADRQDVSESGTPQWSAELFLFRGHDREEALRDVEKIQQLLDNNSQWRLRDLAFSVSAKEGRPVQIAIVASDASDLKAKLREARSASANTEGLYFANALRGSVAFVFPGQGSQRPGMFADLFVAFPQLQRYLKLGSRWRNPLFPPAPFTPEERSAQNSAITDTRVAQPALGIAGLALNSLLRGFGVTPDMLAGHSYGELVALSAAGAIAESELLDLSEARGRCIVEASGDDAGAMAAVSSEAARVAKEIAGLPGIVIANYNSPDQCVIAGTTSSVKVAVEQLQSAGLTAREIPVACAFHSPVIAGASKAFAQRLKKVELSAPQLPVWSNSTAKVYSESPKDIRRQLSDHLTLPVRFQAEIEAMYEAGARIFVEAGPGRVLTGLIGRILAAKPHLAVACDQAGSNGIRQLLLALAQLAVHGVRVDVPALFVGRNAERFNLENLEALCASMVPPSTWFINGHTARPLNGELPEYAMRPLNEPVVIMPTVSDRDVVISDYLRGIREIVQSQRDVMLQYLGANPAMQQAQVSIVPRPVQAVERKALPEKIINLDPKSQLLMIVSERTGYPIDMLDLDLDIEADLSIDSIKRVEIIGILGERLGLRDRSDLEPDKAVEQLAALKTLRGIIGWLEKLHDSATPAAIEPHSAMSAAIEPRMDVPLIAEAAPAPTELRRFTVAVERTPAAHVNGLNLQGRHFVLTEDTLGVADSLKKMLEASGASVEVTSNGTSARKADGLIHLASLSPDSTGASLNQLLDLSTKVLSGGAGHLLAATGLGGSFGRAAAEQHRFGGVSGFVKSVAKEWPDLWARVVDLNPAEEAQALAGHLHRELLADDNLLEVGYTAGVRQVLQVGRADLPRDAKTTLALDSESVVFLTGGARGVTALITRELAERYKCKLVLVGRSPMPEGEEDPELALARSPVELRQAILRQGKLTAPAQIEAACKQILAAREIRHTLKSVREAGASATYHSLDVNDRPAFSALIESIYKQFGRIDGVIHGAGVIDDKFLKHKSAETFRRVFNTKVSSALTLSEKLRRDVRFVIFFSSVAGIFGNRGQVDYAAANEALDKLAYGLARRIEGRVVSINWGPWNGVGMVTPELQREYARIGLPLIPPAAGVKAFFDELLRGPRADTQVAWLPIDAEVFQ